MALCLPAGRIGRATWQEWIGRVSAFASMAPNDVEAIIQHMVDVGILFEDEGMLAMGAEVLPVLRDLFPGRLWFNRWEPHIQAPGGRSVSGLCRTLVAFGDSSLDFVLRFWVSDPQDGLTNVRGAVLLACWDAFKQAGIGIPFPHREIIMRTPVETAKEAEPPAAPA